MNQLPRTPPHANRQEIYVSTDVEADGPIPDPHSMLSFGSAAYLADKTPLTTFSANLDTLPDAQGHPETMAWWATQPVAWAACRLIQDSRRRLSYPRQYYEMVLVPMQDAGKRQFAKVVHFESQRPSSEVQLLGDVD